MSYSFWERYRQVDLPLPAQQALWPFSGAGLDSVGHDGAPVHAPMPRPAEDQILARVDAVGICASDAKMVRLGGDYPLFHGRDLAAQPVRLGHEVALTVVEAGAAWQGRWQPGQRLALQPDIFVDQVRTCFGVLIPGGFAQYLLLDPAVLGSPAAQTAGSAPQGYVFPAPDAVSYAAVALLEPWACVDAAFVPRRRLARKPGGRLLVQGHPGLDLPFHFTSPVASGLVTLVDAPPALSAQMQEAAAREGFTLRRADATEIDTAYDDIILLAPPDSAAVEQTLDRLAPGGTLAVLVADSTAARRLASVAVDAGHIHYQFMAVMGAVGLDVDAAYGAERNRSELRAGGVTLVAGAGGPMGRMHVQRALQMADGPGTVIATNRGTERLAQLLREMRPLAEAQGRTLLGVSPTAEPGQPAALVDEATGGRGCDDIVVMAPDLDLMQEMVGQLAPDGLLALFAGVPPGKRITFPVADIIRHGAQLTGTSGSTLADQQRILAQAVAGELSLDSSVAAIGGIGAVRDGIQAVAAGTYAGKVMIYPQFTGLPLLGLDTLAETLPAVHARLGPGGSWNKAAEQALFAVLGDAGSLAGAKGESP